MSTADLDALADTLRAAAQAYYDTDVETMPDAEYDDGVEQLRIAVTEDAQRPDPELVGRYDDLLTKVAAGASAGGDVAHTSLMGSMEKVVGLEAVAEFVTKIDAPVVVEPKLDGLAIRAVYSAGELTLVATRGDGTTGEDITARVRTLEITGLPAALDDQSLSIEVRGEVFVTDPGFLRANEIRLASSEKATAFVNPRNAAAGILRKGDASFARILSFAAYEELPVDGETALAVSHEERLTRLETAGVGTVHSLVPGFVHTATTDTELVEERITFLGVNREELGFPIDGAIIKADLDADRARLGYGSRAPKWAVAYKYEAETATTVVTAIETSVGRTGRLSLRVQVEPVFVGGTTITYASGHNAGWMVERDVRVGDTVVVKRAGDVIPYIADVMLDRRPEGSQPWTPPETDPVGNPWDKTTLLWRSTSPELSVLGKIVYACSRDCLDIEGIGTEVATALVDSGLVSTIADLFTLTPEDLDGLDLSGRRLGANAAKIYDQIQKAKDTPWNRIITALGIRATGRTMGRRLAAAFPTMDLLRAATLPELAAVNGIGEIKATLMYDGLHELEAAGILDQLAAAGVNMGTEPVVDPDAAPLPLTGMTVVVSGSVPGLTRGEIAEVIEAAGGKASSSVSKTTSLLVSEPSTSSKYVKAESLGVQIMSPEDFLVLLGRA